MVCIRIRGAVRQYKFVIVIHWHLDLILNLVVPTGAEPTAEPAGSIFNMTSSDGSKLKYANKH